jgi:hypothetical protein
MKSAIFCLVCVCACVSCRPAQTGISRSTITNDPELNTLTADMGRSTNVIAVGEWSEPVKDAEGYVLRGRLLLFDPPHYTNQHPAGASQELWGRAPVFLELENLSPPTKKSLAVYFAMGDGLECEMRDLRGNLLAFESGMFAFSGSIRPFTRQYWVMIPSDGSVRLHADPQGIISSQKPKGLEINFGMSPGWLIPAGDTNAYYLSGNFSPPTNHPAPPGSHAWQGKLLLPPMKIIAPKT